ncbi:hypothetical protein KsCSTR_09820 [Candidatus Kuenenia stuttgartiensis]|jgi:hypothetical protein|nr:MULTISPECIES: hypothetical protein [Kuenenia]MBE7547452.1 hypothetical protein [Planctomycetia bacterium]MBZ0193411.1 hypothetical protein [Candidatus Kuenenia stuttgartiensis]MCF6152885.1 hypothetical protein [Candidatus Kuenenia stuttgartiensis]MCZ7624207.1 hypothetical protein [Candidatus Kuenenia sp.]QII10361.1 hypothetical protein KsCSTR_09820 [Candidatus Kuenenia stuttgartiensis]
MQQKAAIKNSLTTKGTKDIQNAKDAKKNLQKKKFLRGNTIYPALITKVFFAASTQIAHNCVAHTFAGRKGIILPWTSRNQTSTKHKANSKILPLIPSKGGECPPLAVVQGVDLYSAFRISTSMVAVFT